ncbi:MAG: GspE/PulE family protein [Patescibacteria group bacterium]|jgi:type IV pilus assembly protein PilB
MKSKLLARIITEANLLAPDQLKSATEVAEQQNVELDRYLVDENLISENVLYEAIASYYKLPFVDLKQSTIRKDVLEAVPEPLVQVHQLVAYDMDPKKIKIATLDPRDLQTFEFIKKKTGLNPEIAITTPSSIKNALGQFHKGLSATFKEITKETEESEETGGEKKLSELAEDLPIVRIVDSMLEYAVFESASDIHIEPQENELIVRYRIDGRLKQVMTLPKNTQSGIIARIKILSNLKIDEHRLPQDGRFTIASKDYKVAFRVSILPVYDGEKAVLRLLNESAQVLTLEQLGLQPNPLEILKRNIKKPHGIILVTGPTGSGKTTTLYTVLNILNKPEVNISTVEDPIEYRMPRVNQSQVNPKIGFSFAGGLRSLLRQDPNIIMVGEIRDNETAEIAANAAMTGHLVLSTLHTNDAVTALPRLGEMGVPSFLIASTTNILMAQRLVRKICLHCIQSYTLTKAAVEDLSKQFNVDFILKTLEREGAIISATTPIESLLFYRGKGCKQCNHEGYKGRIGIYEVLEITHEIADLILNKGTTEDLRRASQKQGMLTMAEDGFIKAKYGITTIEEVLRVTKE